MNYRYSDPRRSSSSSCAFPVGASALNSTGDPFVLHQQSRLSDSMTTASDDTATTRSTIRTVNFRDPITTISEPEVGSTPMTQSIHVEQLLTDNILIHHPRSLLILAFIQLAVSVQLLIFGMICTFYDGCPHGTVLWTSVLFILNSSLGFVFLKLVSKKYVLIIYCCTSVLCLLLTICLFGITAWLLDQEDQILQVEGWKQHLMEINRIVENTKIAMYTLMLVLAPVHGLCCAASAILLCINSTDTEEGHVRSGYYVSNSPVGHQTVLVPIELKQVKQLPVQTQANSPGRAVSVAVQT